MRTIIKSGSGGACGGNGVALDSRRDLGGLAALQPFVPNLIGVFWERRNTFLELISVSILFYRTPRQVMGHTWARVSYYLLPSRRSPLRRASRRPRVSLYCRETCRPSRRPRVSLYCRETCRRLYTLDKPNIVCLKSCVQLSIATSSSISVLSGNVSTSVHTG
ncbi:hypothetical protein J6590_063268 [Homalodisca vitripennis]|nr:hypothetical protein J6590_063268 [Homalodisca vitripennis]